MDVRIAQPIGYSELGGRSNNEDSIFPDPQYASPRQKWFLVCDGVGGAERGEVASKLAATSLDAFLQQTPVAVATDEYLQQAVAYAENQFNAYILENPQAAGMATTVTMIYFHEAGATVAHIGDSRVYHVRDGKVIWRTDDHSYVNELVKAGVLTPVEALRHPQRNIITRALQGGERTVHASVQLINDIKPGDYFFLCSDGVLERVSDELLVGTLSNNADTNEQKLAKLQGFSYGNTRDNFTAYLISIEQVSGAIDPTYKVTAPVYEQAISDSEADETITLINMPVPEGIKVESSKVPSMQVPVLAPQEADTRPLASPGLPVSNRLTNVESKGEHNYSEPLSSAQRSSNRWLIVVLGLVGALVGAGGIIIWQRINDKKESPIYTQPVKNQVAPPIVKPQSSTLLANAAPTANTFAADQRKLDEKTEEASLKPVKSAVSGSSSSLNSSVGLSVEPKKEVSPGADAAYETVNKVNNHVSVVRDPVTKLMGLRTSTGQWPAHKIYTRIGPFENGIAAVETSKGSEKYLSQEGKKFRTFTEYKDGIATLIGTDDKKSFLSKGGTWFEEVKPSSNGKIAVRKDKRWGYLNLQGDVSIRLQYDKAESFQDDGTAEVSQHGETFRIDKNGGKITARKDDSKSTDTKQQEVKKG